MAPTLRIVLRSAPGENMKRRPPGYSKAVALASFARAAREAGEGVQVVYLNDGTMPDDRDRIMRATGEIVELPRDPSVSGWAGMLRSYRAGLRLHESFDWAPDDLVYLGEDDYLFRPEAFAELRAAADAIPAASYLALQGLLLDHRTEMRMVGEHPWMKAYATTCSIAARVRTLRTDAALHGRALIEAGGDTHAFQALQGERPFTWSSLVGAVLFGVPGEPMPLRRRLGRALRGSRMNAAAVRRSFAPHLLFIPDTPLAVHWEEPFRGHRPLSFDWDAVADEAVAWAAAELDVHLPAGAEAAVLS